MNVSTNLDTAFIRLIFRLSFNLPRTSHHHRSISRRTAKNYPVSAGYSAPRIITITSVVAELVFAGGSIYNSSKHAAAGLMSTLRLELGKFGVKVVQVQPWFVNSAFFNVLNPAEAEKIRDRVEPEVLEAYGGEKLLKSLDKVGLARVSARIIIALCPSDTADNPQESLTKQIPMLVPTDVAYAMIHEALLPADPVPHVVVGTLGKVMLRLRRWLPYWMSDKILSM
jgi:NAD(P)-dependent dehydrogenase (short-subunit alcohol dehydrogenase family)